MSQNLLELFVGRQAELAAIQEQVRQGGTRWAIVSGRGGIGKTHLLRQIAALGPDDPTVLLCPIIDFDEVENWVARLVMQRIAHGLGAEHFPEYLQALQKLDKMISLGAFEAQQIKDEEDQAEARFFAEYGALARKRRVVLRLDTFEKVRHFGVGEALCQRVLPRLENTLVVLAGRELETLAEELVARYGQEKVACLPLGAFTAQEADEFFDYTDMDGRIGDELRRRIEFLAEGRPIMLGLAVEWLRLGVPLPKMLDRSIDELRALPENELSELRDRFEFELVSGVRSLRTPRDKAILYMAHFSRRCDERMLLLLMGQPEADIAPLVQDLRSLFFVKPQPRLQDEMAVLVNRHVWPKVDPHGTVRAELTRQVVEQYYDPIIADLDMRLEKQKRESIELKREGVQLTLKEQPAWEKWVMEAERLHGLLWLDFQKGYDDFAAKFEEAIREGHLDRCELLLDEVSGDEWKGELEKNRSLSANLVLKRARFLARQETPERIQEAASICRTILKRRGLSTKNRLEAWSALGGMLTSAAERVQCYQTGVRLARRLRDKDLTGDMARYLGWAYRQMGRWNLAAEWYKTALQYHESHRPIQHQDIATASNNLAYVHRLMGETGQALELAETALKLREQYGSERDLALSYRTLGQIWSDQRDTWKAKEFFERAADIFANLGHRRDLADTYIGIANIYRQQHYPLDVDRYSQLAIGIFEEMRDKGGLLDAYNEYGCELRKRGHELSRSGEPGADKVLAEAERYLEQAIRLGEETENWYKLTDALVDLALLRLYQGRHEKNVGEAYQAAEQYLARAEQLSSQYAFVLFQGRLQELRGDFLREMGRFEEAYLDYYAPAVATLAGYPSMRFQETFRRVSGRLWDLDLPAEEISALCDRLIGFCRGHAKRRKLDSFVRVCERVKRLRGSGGAR